MQNIKDVKENLRIIVCNSNSIKNRKAELEYLVKTTQPDIILSCESKLDNSVKSSEFVPNNYIADIRRDRTYFGGGVVIIHKADLVIQETEIVVPKPDQSNYPGDFHDEIVWAKLTIKNSCPVYIASYYRSSSNYNADSLSLLNESLEYLNTNVIKNSRATIIIGGDFNVPDVDWEKDLPRPSNTYMKPLVLNLLDTLSSNGLTQLQYQPTWNTSVSDLFCTSRPDLIKSVDLIPGFSDHSFVIVDTLLKPVVIKRPRRKIVKWKKAEWKTIKEKTKEFVSAAIQSTKTVDPLYVSFLDHYTSMETHAPVSFFKRNTDLPWLSPSLKRLCRKKNRLFKKAKKSSSSKDSKAFEDDRDSPEWREYKQFANQTKKSVRRAERAHINNILKTAERDRNCKPFYSYVKSKRQDSSGVSPLIVDGKVYPDSVGKAEMLQKQFTSVFSSDEGCADSNKSLPGKSHPDMAEISITVKGVECLLANINPSKAGGPDKVVGIFLKTLSKELAPFFAHLFKLSYDTGDLPSLWKEQWVNPIFKKGLRSKPSNYRPVSLTCIPSKLMEHIICSQVRGHLDREKILSRFQHGFRSKHSCETQLLLTTHDISSLVDTNTQVDIGVLDFSKAFDVVPHQRLLNKLSFYGIVGKTHRWINNFLCGRTQRVLVDGHLSDPAGVGSGVPQGTVLGPLLFLLYINDLPLMVSPGTRIRLFADDCLIYRPIKSPEDHVILQRDLDAVSQWAKQWGMAFNTSKCNVLSTCSSSHRFYTMDSDILQQVDHATYLGLSFSSDLSWSNHVDQVAKKAYQKLGFVRRNLQGAPKRSKSTAYTCLIRPGMEYAAPIWDPYLQKDIASLEKVQRKAARWVKSDYSSRSSVTSMLNDLKWEPLADRRKTSKLGLFHKIHHKEVALDFKRDFGLSPVVNKRKRMANRQYGAYVVKNVVEKYENLHSKCYKPPETNKRPFQQSTICSTVPAWNALTEEQINLPYSKFKRQLSKY